MGEKMENWTKEKEVRGERMAQIDLPHGFVVRRWADAVSIVAFEDGETLTTAWQAPAPAMLTAALAALGYPAGLAAALITNSPAATREMMTDAPDLLRPTAVGSLREWWRTGQF